MLTQEELLSRFGPVEDPEIEARRQRIIVNDNYVTYLFNDQAYASKFMSEN